MSKFFINRPIVAMVIAILMVIVGAITIAQLPVAQFPAIAPPEVMIQANYVGADSQTVEQSVATPIEQQMSGVDNLNYMYSLNAANGQMTMIVDFDVKTDPNTDLILTQMRETQAASQLPVDVTNYGVTVQKSVTAPLMVIGLYSPRGTYDAKFLANYSYINLNDQLTQVRAGLASAELVRSHRIHQWPGRLDPHSGISRFTLPRSANCPLPNDRWGRILAPHSHARYFGCAMQGCACVQ